MTAVATPGPPETPVPLPVPAGITVLEASAGTGKTHRVTSLAVEAVAAGLPLERMLLVTFTRAATGELRDRVWQRLVDVEAQIRTHLEAGAEPEDELAAALVAAGGDLAAVVGRLGRAVGRFDAATIATIHGFCEQVLSEVGYAGDVERDVTFIEDMRVLTEQVVDDLLVQRFHKNVAFTFPREVALEIARAVITDPHATILPPEDDPDRGAAMRSRFARTVRSRLDRRKRELRAIGFDDLLTRLESTLQGTGRDVVRDRLQRQYSLVVVDEFQDTDVVQWNIMREAFGASDTAVVLVGDPKQAIYSFRGADVHAYLAARGDATATDHLPVNYRSDGGLLRGLDAVFGSATLGHPDIAYRSTRPAPHHEAPRLRGGRRPAPVRIRHVPRSAPDAVLTDTRGDLQAGWALSFVADDLAAEIVHQLSPATRSTIVERATDGTERERPVQPGDIAVLVSRHRDADLVRDALAAAGVPAVVNGAGRVFDTDAAADWLTLLEAIETPAATTKVRSAALTPFIGWSAAEVATTDDTAWDGVHDRLHRWRHLLETRSVAALFEHLSTTEGLPARLLACDGGERTLTDLRHMAELLHAQGMATDTTPATLIEWLRARRREKVDEFDADSQSRRLETDADAVQVWTVHRSKGLQFPIVHVPFLWRPGWIPEDAPPVFHDPLTDARCVDVGGPRPGQAQARARFEAEKRGEELRLAYVALTRAQHQVVVWWASTYHACESPLGTLLFAPHAGGDLTETPADERVGTILGVLAQQADGAVVVEEAAGATEHRFAPERGDAADLGVRRFGRSIDREWRRTSYSALTAVAHEAPHGAAAPEHDDRGLEDERMPEPPPAAPADADEARLRAVPTVFGEVGGGARFGTMVHGVLEETDFSAPDLDRELREALAGTHHAVTDDLDSGVLLAGLAAAIETPLGPLVDDLRLRDVGRGDRLDELHFELPLVGGDSPSGALTLDAIADVVAGTLPADDVLAGYDQHLRHPDLTQTVRGYLSGSIDVVLRAGGRYVVVDHKSNWLGVEGEDLSAWHYRPAALRDAMVRAHYPLQAMLYSVALHRYLRWRQPGYEPAQHLGGVLYLFLRGMTGADVPRVEGQPCGVFSWTPPVALVTGLSDVLDRGR